MSTFMDHIHRPEAPTRSYADHVLDAAQAAYDRQDPQWFCRLPTEHLTFLWGVACSASGLECDDEVYDALAERGFFEEAPRL